AVLVLLPVPVPVELELHPPVLVRPDLLAGLAHDQRRLRPVHRRLPGLPRRAVRHRMRDRQELGPVLELARLTRMVPGRPCHVLYAQQRERVLAEPRAEVVLDREPVPAAQRAARALAPYHAAQRLLRLEP